MRAVTSPRISLSDDLKLNRLPQYAFETIPEFGPPNPVDSRPSNGDVVLGRIVGLRVDYPREQIAIGYRWDVAEAIQASAAA